MYLNRRSWRSHTLLASCLATVALLLTAPACGTDSEATPQGNFALLVASSAPLDAELAHFWLDIDRVELVSEARPNVRLSLPNELRSVDLAGTDDQLAQLLTRQDVPTQAYDGVRLHIASLRGVSVSGEPVLARLPSSWLSVDVSFGVAADPLTSFVFNLEVTPVEPSQKAAGYQLAAHQATSGPEDANNPISRATSSQSLSVQIEGPDPDGAFTIEARDSNGDFVSGADFDLAIELGTQTTDEHGVAIFDMPTDFDDMHVEVAQGDRRGEMQMMFGNGNLETLTSSEGLDLWLIWDGFRNASSFNNRLVEGTAAQLLITDSSGSVAEATVEPRFMIHSALGSESSVASITLPASVTQFHARVWSRDAYGIAIWIASE